MQNKTNTKKVKQTYEDINPVEAFKGIGKGVVGSMVDDLGAASINSMWDQFLGAHESGHENSGDLHEGQEISLAGHKNEEENEEKSKHLDVDPGIDYRSEILHGERRISQENSQEIQTKIQEIIIELKRLTQTSKVLQAEFREVTIEQRIEKPGKYHVNFFEWVLMMVKAARIKVENSGSWLSTFKSKKKQKQYWAMFKKHGTTFGLSNERVVATQTG